MTETPTDTVSSPADLVPELLRTGALIRAQAALAERILHGPHALAEDPDLQALLELGELLQDQFAGLMRAVNEVV